MDLYKKQYPFNKPDLPSLYLCVTMQLLMQLLTFLSKNLISKAKVTLVNHSGYKVFTYQLSIHTCARLLRGIFLKSFVILVKSL